MTLVEANDDNPKSGLGQCLASMVGAQVFNERRGDPGDCLYGVDTTGTLWRFLTLEGTVATLDAREHHIERVGRILGVLSAMVGLKLATHS